MSSPIQTTAPLHKSSRLILPADIATLDTVPVLIAQGTAGKTINLVALLASYIYGTTTYTVAGGALAKIFFGNSNAGTAANSSEILAALIDGQTASQQANIGAGGTLEPSAVTPQLALQGLGLWLVETHTGWTATGDGKVILDAYYLLT